MLRHLKTKLAVILLIVNASAPVTNAQPSRYPHIFGENNGISGVDCEGIQARLDSVAVDAEEAGKDQIIIIIARLGSGESSRSLAGARLRLAAGYLNRRRRSAAGRVVTAEGERVRGLGLVEFYVAGRLHTIFKVKRNRDLIKGCVPAG